MLIVLKIFQIWETDRREGRKSRRKGKEQRKRKKTKTGRNTRVRKESIEVPRQRHVIIQKQVAPVLDGSSKTCLSLHWYPKC